MHQPHPAGPCEAHGSFDLRSRVTAGEHVSRDVNAPLGTAGHPASGQHGLPVTCALPGMEEGRKGRRTIDGHKPDDSAGASGWTTTDVAARALGVSPRGVRRFIDRGELEGHKVKEGIGQRRHSGGLGSLDRLPPGAPGPRSPEGRDRGKVHRESDEGTPPTDASADMADLIRGLTTDLVRTASEATELRVRLELTERAESTLREELTRKNLEALIRAHGSPKSRTRKQRATRGGCDGSGGDVGTGQVDGRSTGSHRARDL